MAKNMEKIDGMAYTIMALGAINSGLIGLARMNMMSRLFGRKSKVMRAAYAAVGIASIYRTARFLIPKTRHERRLQKIDNALTKIEDMEKKATPYLKAADSYKKRLLKNRPKLAANFRY